MKNSVLQVPWCAFSEDVDALVGPVGPFQRAHRPPKTRVDLRGGLSSPAISHWEGRAINRRQGVPGQRPLGRDAAWLVRPSQPERSTTDRTVPTRRRCVAKDHSCPAARRSRIGRPLKTTPRPVQGCGNKSAGQKTCIWVRSPSTAEVWQPPGQTPDAKRCIAVTANAADNSGLRRHMVISCLLAT